jgi:hypothetical protein
MLSRHKFASMVSLSLLHYIFPEPTMQIGSCFMLCRHYIQSRTSRTTSHQTAVPAIVFDVLAVLLDGFSAAEIKGIVDKNVLTEDRLKVLTNQPLSEHDFTCHLNNRENLMI